MPQTITDTQNCYHCGENCGSHVITLHQRAFCCEGCRMVYQILNKEDLCEYYTLNKNPGVSRKKAGRSDKFVFLDDEEVQKKLISFKNETQSHIIFYLPQMHCSSCIWLLENLSRLDRGIISSRVDFMKKEVIIVFNHQETTLRKMAEICATVGYEPHISLHQLSEKDKTIYDRSKIYKIGIAGFCFGNIMMLSFPEYFSGGGMAEQNLKSLFSVLNLVLALPVFFYCAADFFVSAWQGLRQKFLNIDAPIALALLITFIRSVYEIGTGTGAGYLDSMSGIVFFMLLGRFFQDETHHTLSFNRDYTSYFPLGATVLNEDGSQKQIPVSRLKVGDRIKIHHQEIIPADAILFRGKACIDYSFVSGESVPIEKGIGEIVYAGGKQTGGALELEVVKEVSQSYLTQLWNNEAFNKEKNEESSSFIHPLSRYFTIILFSIAACAALYWFFADPSLILDAITSILIVACPCSLLLSATFTNGNVLKILQKYGFYVRNEQTLEAIGKASAIVFDKTGTITLQNSAKVVFDGGELSAYEQQIIRSLAWQSSHPLSKNISDFLPAQKIIPAVSYRDIPGKGIEADFGNDHVQLGSANWLGIPEQQQSNCAFVRINGRLAGSFKTGSAYRSGFSELIKRLKNKFRLHLLSGDHAGDAEPLKRVFGRNSELLFRQQPEDKLRFIQRLQGQGNKVIMIGDGLNDAGALKQSDIGIAVTDNMNNFSPACDVIFDGRHFQALDRILEYCKKSTRIIQYSFVLSVLYNIVGLYFAFTCRLEPVIAAILMPVSSISIILFTTGLSHWMARHIRKSTDISAKNAKGDEDHTLV